MKIANTSENIITVTVSFQAVFLSGQVTFFSSCHELTKYPLNGDRSIVRLRNFHAFVFLTGAEILAAPEPIFPATFLVRFPITLLPIKKEPIWLTDASVAYFYGRIQPI